MARRGIGWTISKNKTLALTPAIGLLILISTITFRDAPDAGFATLGLAMMLIFLAAHWSAVRRGPLGQPSGSRCALNSTGMRSILKG